MKMRVRLIEEKAVKLNNKEVNEHMADLFSDWGTILQNLAELKKDETLLEQSIKKYEKAVSLNPNHANAFNNWGNAISELAKLTKTKRFSNKVLRNTKKQFLLIRIIRTLSSIGEQRISQLAEI